MPRIEAATIAEQREWRRQQLIDAAASIALESGGAAITVAAVAQRAGLARTSVYEYFASSDELVADLIISELRAFAQTLSDAVSDERQSEEIIRKWVVAALTYIADGRHLLAKALNSVTPTGARAHEIGAAHRHLLQPLHSALSEMGIEDKSYALSMVQSLTDASAKRIEAGAKAEEEIARTSSFCVAGLRSLIS